MIQSPRLSSNGYEKFAAAVTPHMFSAISDPEAHIVVGEEILES